VHEENFITVLLPVYNSQPYVGAAIKSMLNQTYDQFELLIIDDGSTDNTASVVKSFNDDRINYLYKEHTGLAESLNFGLQKAKYNYIARMDSDDISHENRLDETN
jgi:glycosyltransferase involved in cell wall biosynthesis